MITIIVIGQTPIHSAFGSKRKKVSNKISCLHAKTENLKTNKDQDKSLVLSKCGKKICNISFIHFFHSFTTLGTGIRIVRQEIISSMLYFSGKRYREKSKCIRL